MPQLLDQKDSAPSPRTGSDDEGHNKRPSNDAHPRSACLVLGHGWDDKERLSDSGTGAYGGSSSTGASLIDKDDNDFVLVDAKLPSLLHTLRKEYRVKLRKLARYVCKFMVPEGEKKRIERYQCRTMTTQVCNLPVKILWPFKNTVAFDNAVFILTQTKIVETEVLQPLDSRVKETVSMFLE